MIIGIVAISKNHAIGKDGKLPWHYTHDLRFFKETTMGNVVVMGSSTWRAIGKALPGRLNIVLSRSGLGDAPAGVLRLSSNDEIVELAPYLSGDVYIIGGAKTYETFANVIDEWIVTEIPLEIPDADTFFDTRLLNGFETFQRIHLTKELLVKKMRRAPQTIVE